jgi:LPS export ABC transporter protein LptC
MTSLRRKPAVRSIVISNLALRGTLLATLLLLLSALIQGCPDRTEDGVKSSPAEIEVAEDFTLTQTFEGRKAWVLKAESATSLRDDSLVTVYKPHLEFYSREGTIHSTLVSDSGIYYLESSDIKALGNVVVVSADSAVLETDSLKWMSREERIRTEGSVRVTKGSTVITGDGLESDPTLDDIKIERNFRAETLEKES